MSRLGASVFVLALLLGSPSTARAEPTMNEARFEIQATSPPRKPAPFILPELAHDRLDVAVDWFYASLGTTPGTVRNNTPTSMVRLATEANVFLPRRLYLGLSYPIGFAMPPDGGLAAGEAGAPAGARALAGNLQAHIRAVFPLPTWLEIGFLLGITTPTATFDRNRQGDRSAAAAIASLDPSSYVDFLPGRVVLRPAGDLRITRGPLVFQGRHGMDIIFDGSGAESVLVAGRLMAHFGYVIYDSLEVSVEAQQYYFFTADPPATPTFATPGQVFSESYRIKDGSRSALTIGPALRATTRNFDYGVALFTNIADPLSPVGDRMLGMRFSINAHLPVRIH